MIGKGIDPQILELLGVPLDTKVTSAFNRGGADAGMTSGHSVVLYPEAYHHDPSAHNAVYWHELGHVLWQGMNPEEKMQWSDEYNSANGGKVKKPSDYAMSGLGEFFAESFRKQMLKEGLDSKIKDLFAKGGK